jgi:hypothetical protein
MSGLSVERTGPVGEDGTAAVVHTLRRAYAFFDALSGEFLFTIWVE